MDILYLSFLMVNIFALYGYSFPTRDNHLFDYIDVRFITGTCPMLNESVLFDKHSEYLSKCTDVELMNAPKSIDITNLKSFLCVGVFEADIRLCNALSNTTYSYLPNGDAVLKQQIDNIAQLKPDKVCNKFKTIYSNLTDIKPKELLPWMSVLKENLNGPLCVHLCSDLSQTYTNVLCSMLYYINLQIENVTTSKPLVAKVTILDSQIATAHDATPEFQKNITMALPVNSKVNETPNNAQTRAGNKSLGTLAKGRETANTKSLPTQTKSTDITATLNNSISETVLSKVADKETQNAVPKTSAQNDTSKIAQDVVSQEVQNTTQQEIAASIVPNVSHLANDASTVDKMVEIPQVVDNKNDIAPPTVTEGAKVAEDTNLSKGTNMNKLPDIFDTADKGAKDAKDALDANGQADYDDEDEDHVYLLPDASPIAEKINVDAVQIKPVDASGTARHFEEVEDSNFFSYFMFISVMFIFGYVVYHNKQKILALLLEGRRDRSARRRPSTSSYRKLNSNLEEAVTSKCSGSASHVIY